MTVVTERSLMERLAILYAGVGATISNDLTKLSWKAVRSKGGGRAWALNLADQKTQAELYVAAMTAINAVATFWNYALPHFVDVLKVQKAEVENVTETCLALKILRDLHNLDKHPDSGDKLKSGVHPRLANLQLTMRYRGTTGGFDVEVTDQGFIPKFTPGELCVHGEIYNDSTKMGIMSLNRALDEGVAAWEAFLRKYRLIK